MTLSGLPLLWTYGYRRPYHQTQAGFSDEETLLPIQANPYMQYMCGPPEYSDRPIFDPSLCTASRKRITIDDINALTL